MSLNYERFTLSELEKEAYNSDNKLALAILKNFTYMVNDHFDDSDAMKSVYVYDSLPSQNNDDMEPEVMYSSAAEVLDYFLNTDPDQVFPVHGKCKGNRYMICPAFNESNHVYNHHVQLNESGSGMWTLQVHHSEYGEQFEQRKFEAKTIVSARKKAIEEIHHMMSKGKIILHLD